MLMIFGDKYDRLRDRISVHNAHDTGDMVAVGSDQDGSPVYLNRLFLKARKPVIIGSVEPHYFAGYTGGRKAIFPGLSWFRGSNAVLIDCSVG